MQLSGRFAIGWRARGCHILIGDSGVGEEIGGYRQEILSYIEYRICSSFRIFGKRFQGKMCRRNRYIFPSYAFCMRTLSRNAPVYGKEWNKDVTFPRVKAHLNARNSHYGCHCAISMVSFVECTKLFLVLWAQNSAIEHLFPNLITIQWFGKVTSLLMFEVIALNGNIRMFWWHHS